MVQPELVMKFLTVLGTPLRTAIQRNNQKETTSVSYSPGMHGMYCPH